LSMPPQPRGSTLFPYTTLFRSDNCSGTITGTTSDSLTRTTQGTSVVIWHFNDGNGNESTQTQNIVVADLTAPVPDAASLADATRSDEHTADFQPRAQVVCSRML